jgi:hypothetical protein
VPAKPAWYRNINEVIRQLDALPRPFVDSATLEFLLGVGRRRAQQILAPLITDRVGSNGLADRPAVVAYLRRLAEGDEGRWERRRRRHVAEILAELQKERLAHPPLLVEAPITILSQEVDNLPPGVHLDRGRISVEFTNPQQALEKLLALAVAISNDFDRFERQVRPS